MLWMLWKQNTCHKCSDTRLDLLNDWSFLDCHQFSYDQTSSLSSNIYGFSSMFIRLSISLKCWPLRISARSALQHLAAKIYCARYSGFSRCIKSPKTLHRVHLTNLQSGFLPAPGNSSIWQSEYLTSSSLTGQRMQGFARYLAISPYFLHNLSREWDRAYSDCKFEVLTNERKFYRQLGFRLWECWPYLEVSAGKLLRLFSGKVRHIKPNQSHRIKNRKTKISSICSKDRFFEGATADNLLASSRVSLSLLTLPESAKAFTIVIVIFTRDFHYNHHHNH